MNNIKKYVVSRTLTKVDWNNSTLLGGDVADSVRALKETGNGEIAMSSSSTLMPVPARAEAPRRVESSWCTRSWSGRGKRLAEGDGEHLPLELVKSTAFDDGVIHQLYRPAS